MITDLRVELVALAVRDDLDRTGEVDLGDVVEQQLGAEALGLLAQVVHQVGTHDPVGEAGEVLDVGGVHQRAAGGDRALEDQRLRGRRARRRPPPCSPPAPSR